MYNTFVIKKLIESNSVKIRIVTTLGYMRDQSNI